MEERLQKIIARAGVASRRHAEQMIASGLVTVNGTTVTELGSKADQSRDHIKVAGKLLRPAKQRVYLLLHKPAEVVSTMSDPEGRRSLNDLLYGIPERVFPVGRLEYHSAGLVFLTNDGDLANQLLRSHRVRQTYHLKLKTLLTFAEIEALGRATGAHIERLRGKESPWYVVTLSEARSDALRDKLFQTGHPVEKIRRVGIANLELGSLAPGSHRALSPVELVAFTRAISTGESSAQPRDKHSSRPSSSRNWGRAAQNNPRHSSSQPAARAGQHTPPSNSPRGPARTADRSQRSTSHAAASPPGADRPVHDNPRNPFFRPGQHGADRTSPHKTPSASPRTGNRAAPGNWRGNMDRTSSGSSHSTPPRTGPPNARYTTPRNAPRTGQHKPGVRKNKR